MLKTSRTDAIWEWEDDSAGSGKWCAYDSVCTTALCGALAIGQTSVILQIKGCTYDVDLTAMEQTKRDTGFVRAIRTHQSTDFIWEWEDGAAGSGKWCAYDSACATVLTAALTAGQGAVILQIKGGLYDIDLLGPDMQQTKKDTGFVRRVRQLPPSATTVVTTMPSTPSSPTVSTVASQSVLGDNGGTSTVASTTHWQWEDENVGSGKWCAYDSACSAALTSALVASQVSLKLQIKGSMYTVDLVGMKQTKLDTSFVRAIRCTYISKIPVDLCSFPGTYSIMPSYWSLVESEPEPEFEPEPEPEPDAEPEPEHVIWEWEDNKAGSGKWCRYDDTYAAKLSAASAAHEATVALQINGEDYTVDLGAMQQTKISTSFVRAIRAGAAWPAPPKVTSWLSACALPVAGPAHNAVLQELASTATLANYHVLKISLIRDRGKFGAYMARKDQFALKLGDVNEHWLWHGTSSDLLMPILTNGFLRDYNTTAAYGHGTYFAKEAKYSLQSSYSKPGNDGIQNLLLVRVLVGEPCVGRSGMTKPDQKNGQLELHESMVNSISQPSIFVLSAGSDNQAYAEFWVQIRRK
jgi:hypothetical protein